MMNKSIKLLSLSALCTMMTLNAVTFEYNTLYKDTRVMGMGGANVALGGESSAVFYNPAGLSGIDPRDGLELEIVNISATISDKTIALGLDGMDLANSPKIGEGDYSEISPFLTKYTGSPVSAGLSDFSSVAYRGNSWALSIGVLANVNLAVQIHNPLSTSGIIEAQGVTNTGVVTGFSMDFFEDNTLHVGIGAKYLFGEVEGIQFNNSVKLGLSPEHIGALMSEEDAVKYLVDEGMLNPYTQLVFDAGVIYDLNNIIPLGDFLRPSVALSYINIGNIVAPNGDIIIPQTVNLGVALRPNFYLLTDWLLTDWVFTADYIDTLYAYEDGSFGKRLRMGTRVSLIKGFLGELTASAGLYNASWTAGAQLRLLFLDVMFATYAEELGATPGQDPDRRYQFSLAMGF